jgi:hypothetical protein
MLRSQLPGLLVERIDEGDSFRLVPTEGVDFDDARGVFADAEVEDADGASVYLLLHVMHGRLAELEVYRADLGRVRRDLCPHDVEFHII